MDATWLNIVNLIIGLAVLALLVNRTMMRRFEFPQAVITLHYLAIDLLVGLLVVSAYGIVEDTLPLFGILSITVVKAIALVTLWQTRNTLYRTGTRYDDAVDEGRNKDRDHPDEDITAV